LSPIPEVTVEVGTEVLFRPRAVVTEGEDRDTGFYDY